MQVKKKVDVLVIGSGAGGLGAGCWLKDKGFSFLIVDSANELPLNLHNGVHYLHSIPELPFDSNLKKITLTDAILHDGKFYHEPNLMFALEYSEKVRDVQHPSSIMNVGKDDHAFMPDGNMNDFLMMMASYIDMENIQFKTWITNIDKDKKEASVNENGEKYIIQYDSIISTIPMEVMFKYIGYKDPEIDFLNTSIYITNYRIMNIVPNWMISLYIPSQDITPYRASILNGTCSVESMEELSEAEIKKRIPHALKMFSLDLTAKTTSFKWENGKIMSISTDQRRRIADQLSQYGIFQIGRFGLWNRKLLVDSTINQAHAVVEYLKYGGWAPVLAKLTQ